MASPARIDNTVYLPTGSPLTSVETNKFRSGEFGHIYCGVDGKRWQNVKAGGAFTHAPVVTEVWYWAAGHGFLVDPDYTDSEATINALAGVLPTGATVPLINQYFWLLQEAPTTTVAGVTGINFTAGSIIIGSTTVGKISAVASTVAPTGQGYGTVHTAVDNSGGAGPVVCDINFPSRIY